MTRRPTDLPAARPASRLVQAATERRYEQESRRRAKSTHLRAVNEQGLFDEHETAHAWRVVLTTLRLWAVCPRDACRRSCTCLAAGDMACLRLTPEAHSYVTSCLLAGLDQRFRPKAGSGGR